MVILDIAELIPRDHLLRKTNQKVLFDFIYDRIAPYYPANSWIDIEVEVEQSMLSYLDDRKAPR